MRAGDPELEVGDPFTARLIVPQSVEEIRALDRAVAALDEVAVRVLHDERLTGLDEPKPEDRALHARRLDLVEEHMPTDDEPLPVRGFVQVSLYSNRFSTGKAPSSLFLPSRMMTSAVPVPVTWTGKPQSSVKDHSRISRNLSRTVACADAATERDSSATATRPVMILLIETFSFPPPRLRGGAVAGSLSELSTGRERWGRRAEHLPLTPHA